AQQFTRSPFRVAQDDMDHYVIQTHLAGEQTMQRGSKAVTSRPGDLHIIDLTETHEAQVSDFTNLSLVVPRNLLAPLLAQADDQHGRVLSAERGLTRLAVQHLRTMAETMHLLSPEDALQTIEPTLLLLASAINGNPEAQQSDSSVGNASVLSRAKL